MKTNQTLKTIAAVLVLAVFSVRADDAETIKRLEQRLDELDQKVKVLERRGELDKEVAIEKSKAQPAVSIGASGVNLTSADSNFVFQIHGLVQFDSRTFVNDGGNQNNDSFLLRRARPIFSGTLYRDFDFMFVPDFGGNTVQIVDAYLNYKYSPALQLRAGKFKPPIGLEQLQADAVTAFNERSLVADLIPNRDIGAQVWGELFGGTVNYAAGIFNGSPDFTGTTTNADSSDDLKGFAGRVFFQPWKNSSKRALSGLGFGVGGSYATERGANLTSGYTTDGQQRFFTYTNGIVANGTHWRISPQAYYYYGPFSLLGEYVISDQRVTRTVAPVQSKELQNTAWEITAGWVLTGEDASYTGVSPRHPFNPHEGEWGAFQLVGRFAGLDVDKGAFPQFANGVSSASSARAWGVGLNWFLNRNLRVNTSFSRTTFSGGHGTTGLVTKQPENVLFTRIQLGF